MLIQIFKGKIGLFHKQYEIVVDNISEFKAKILISFFSPEIRIFSSKGHRFARIIKLFNDFKVDCPRYDIVFRYHLNVRLTTFSLGHYKVFQENAVYEVIEQNDKFGIFFESKQIGLINFKINHSSNNPTYELVIDTNLVDKEVVIGFILAYDNFFNKLFTTKNEISRQMRYNIDLSVDQNWTLKN